MDERLKQLKADQDQAAADMRTADASGDHDAFKAAEKRYDDLGNKIQARERELEREKNEREQRQRRLEGLTPAAATARAVAHVERETGQPITREVLNAIRDVVRDELGVRTGNRRRSAIPTTDGYRALMYIMGREAPTPGGGRVFTGSEWDNFRNELDERLQQRSRLMHFAMQRAGQSYFNVGTAGDGGNMIPDDTSFMDEIIVARQDFGGLERVSRVYNSMHGRPIPWPSVDDIAAENAGPRAEGANAADVDIDIEQFEIGAHNVSSGRIGWTWEFEDDAYDAAGFVAMLAGERLARKESAGFVNGDGTGINSSGIVGASVANGGSGKGLDLIYDISDASLINGHAVIAEILDSVDHAYVSAPGSAVVMSQSFLKQLRILRDADGRPLYPDLAWRSRGDMPMIGPMPIQIDNNYPKVGVANGDTAKVATVGDHRRFFIRRVMTMRIVRDDLTGAVAGKVYYIVNERVDSRLLDPRAVKHVLVTTRA